MSLIFFSTNNKQGNLYFMESIIYKFIKFKTHTLFFAGISIT